jgi:hypothetical protein
MECSARIWQRNYFEHAIRDDEDLEQKRQYILDNPLKLKRREQHEQHKA